MDPRGVNGNVGVDIRNSGLRIATTTAKWAESNLQSVRNQRSTTVALISFSNFLIFFNLNGYFRTYSTRDLCSNSAHILFVDDLRFPCLSASIFVQNDEFALAHEGRRRRLTEARIISLWNTETVDRCCFTDQVTHLSGYWHERQVAHWLVKSYEGNVIFRLFRFFNLFSVYNFIKYLTIRHAAEVTYCGWIQ